LQAYIIPLLSYALHCFLLKLAIVCCSRQKNKNQKTDDWTENCEFCIVQEHIQD
jgi:hypothetical protein